MEKTISRHIAEFATTIQYQDLPEDVVNRAKRFLFDSLGCALGAMDTQDVQIMRSVYREMAGKEEATVIGFGDRLPMVNTTLVNSLMVRALDYNDIYWREDPSHPSDLIPAALAAGEGAAASMEEVLVAIILGYEFEQRLCEFAKPGVRERKWHHATLTQFVSPVVAGKVLGLTAEELTNAIGISGSHNYTAGCPTAGKLTMMKNTVDPMAVQAGVLAALLAQKGFNGTEAVFEGKEGLMDVLGPHWDHSVLTDGLGSDWRIRTCSMKAFPTEALTHTHISATLKVITENDIKPEAIEEVVVTTIARACDILFDPHKYEPTTRETADHSLPYCLARAILDREITPRTFETERIRDPRLKSIIHRIKGEASTEFEKLFPAKQPSRVTITTKDGALYSAYLEYPKGDPREPMTDDELRTKFTSLVHDRLTPDAVKRLEQMVYTCEGMPAREFMGHLIVNPHQRKR